MVQNARSYLKNAGTILVFAKPDRIDQNPELDHNLRECVHLNKMEETYLIVTKIDQKAALSDRERTNLLPEDSSALNEAETELRALKGRVSDLEKAKADAYEADDIKEYKKFEELRRQLEIDLKSAEMAVKQVEIEIRNRDIARGLKDKFREITGSKHSPDLKILFTSNSVYQKHLAGYNVHDPPMLDVEATGIPAVRRLLYRVPARGKLEVLSRIVRKALPAIFNCISGILTKAPLERKQEVEDLITKVFEKDEEDIMKTAKKELAAAFKDKIGKIFSEFDRKQNILSITDAANTSHRRKQHQVGNHGGSSAGGMGSHEWWIFRCLPKAWRRMETCEAAEGQLEQRTPRYFPGQSLVLFRRAGGRDQCHRARHNVESR